MSLSDNYMQWKCFNYLILSFFANLRGCLVSLRLIFSNCLVHLLLVQLIAPFIACSSYERSKLKYFWNHLFIFVKRIVTQKWKYAKNVLRLRPSRVCFFIRLGEIERYIICSPTDPLQQGCQAQLLRTTALQSLDGTLIKHTWSS